MEYKIQLFPLALRFFPTVTFRLILGEFPWDFSRFASFFSVFSVFSARLVLFWYQSLVSIFWKIGGEKFRYSFPVSDTWLCPTVQLALMFEYKGRCKGRAPWWSVFIITHFRQNYNYLAKNYNCHKCNFSVNVKKSLQRTASPFC